MSKRKDRTKAKRNVPKRREEYDPIFNNGSKSSGYKDGPFDPFKALTKAKSDREDF